MVTSADTITRPNLRKDICSHDRAIACGGLRQPSGRRNSPKTFNKSQQHKQQLQKRRERTGRKNAAAASAALIEARRWKKLKKFNMSRNESMTIPTILDSTNIYLVRHLNIRRRGAPKLLKTRFLWWPGLRSALLTVSNNGVADKSPAM
jgi:hypothetical protein